MNWQELSQVLMMVGGRNEKKSMLSFCISLDFM